MCFETVHHCLGCGAGLGYVINYCGRGDCDSVDTVVNDLGDCGQCHTPTRDNENQGGVAWGALAPSHGGGGGGKLLERT